MTAPGIFIVAGQVQPHKTGEQICELARADGELKPADQDSHGELDIEGIDHADAFGPRQYEEVVPPPLFGQGDRKSVV